jgi:hypothetical protein
MPSDGAAAFTLQIHDRQRTSGHYLRRPERAGRTSGEPIPVLLPSEVFRKALVLEHLFFETPNSALLGF